MVTPPPPPPPTRPATALSPEVHARVAECLERVWGFTTLRPMQMEAIAASLLGRDSLVVMPTGGGKSLCYQLPPLVSGRPALVISPLIALMKDQVDSLTLVGYPAAALNSTVDADDARRAWADIDAGRLKLLFVSPERLFSSSFLARLVKSGISTVAIDEAHCISQWGHDFRPEYRRLRELRDILPNVQINAYTATATPQVRADIVEQLGLRAPAELVGVFDRPNLTYRVLPRMDAAAQTAEAIRRHPGQGSIVYCISRKETESLADSLTRAGIEAKAYHAGLDASLRHDIQDDFSNERLNVVVATVAFGMGIDRSDVRCVVHAGLPKSVEHYQQETGRAGRDGLPSECLLLYSAADAVRWSTLFGRSMESGEGSDEWLAQQRKHLDEMQRFCTSAACRHRLLSEYFGQTYAPPAPAGCGGCDVCLGEVEDVEGASVIAQKILSAVARATMTRRHDGSLATFGVSHIVGILKGSDTKAIRDWGHDKLTTFGLLAHMPKEEIAAYVNQLADQGFVARTQGEFPTIYLTSEARDVLKGTREVKLGRARAIAPEPLGKPRSGRRGEAVILGDPGLFEALRGLRRTLATERGVPPYVVFSDAVLQELAAVRPTRRETMLGVRGVGERKLAEFGKPFADAIQAYCERHGLSMDVGVSARPRAEAPSLNANQLKALGLFERGMSVPEVSAELGLATSTVSGYLVELVDRGSIRDIAPWVAPPEQKEIAETAARIGADRLKPIHEHFAGRYSYEQIRITLIKKAESPAGSSPRG